MIQEYWRRVYYKFDGTAASAGVNFNETENSRLERKTYIYKSINSTDIGSLSSKEREGKTYYTDPLQYGESIEIYVDPENAGQYKTDTEGYNINSWGDNINISNYDATIKTLSAEDIQNPDSKELIYSKDDVFSYTYIHSLAIFSISRAFGIN